MIFKINIIKYMVIYQLIMQLDRYSKYYDFGNILGFSFSYILFSVTLYYLLSFLGKFPLSWTFFHIFGITALISVIGIVFNKVLK